MLATEKAYFIPVIIIEETLPNPVVENGVVVGTVFIPEQFIFIVFKVIEVLVVVESCIVLL